MKRIMALFFVLLFATAPVRADERVTVESIEILIAESFPVQVFAILRGHLSDGCTEITDVSASGPVDNRFHIEITTQRPPDAICTQALVSFERNVPINAYGLLAGDYEVAAGGVSASFTLHQDNKPQ